MMTANERESLKCAGNAKQFANTAMWLCGDIVRSIKGEKEIVLYSGVGLDDRIDITIKVLQKALSEVKAVRNYLTKNGENHG